VIGRDTRRTQGATAPKLTGTGHGGVSMRPLRAAGMTMGRAG
jgi:hypothetical protein